MVDFPVGHNQGLFFERGRPRRGPFFQCGRPPLFAQEGRSSSADDHSRQELDENALRALRSRSQARNTTCRPKSTRSPTPYAARIPIPHKPQHFLRIAGRFSNHKYVPKKKNNISASATYNGGAGDDLPECPDVILSGAVQIMSASS